MEGSYCLSIFIQFWYITIKLPLTEVNIWHAATTSTNNAILNLSIKRFYFWPHSQRFVFSILNFFILKCSVESGLHGRTPYLIYDLQTAQFQHSTIHSICASMKFATQPIIINFLRYLFIFENSNIQILVWSKPYTLYLLLKMILNKALPLHIWGDSVLH